VLGASFSHFGYTQYNEQMFGLAYARSFGTSFSAGIQLDYLSTKIGENYGTKGELTFEAGFISRLNDRTHIAAHVFNPLHIGISGNRTEEIPTIFKFGFAYAFTDRILATVETEKNISYKAGYRGGLEYNIREKVSVRMGYSTCPSPSGSSMINYPAFYTFGFGLNLKRFTLDVSSSVHFVLGWSPHFSFIYKIT